MRCKGSDRAGVACFQFGKRLQITLRRGVFVLLDPPSGSKARKVSDRPRSNRSPTGRPWKSFTLAARSLH